MVENWIVCLWNHRPTEKCQKIQSKKRGWVVGLTVTRRSTKKKLERATEQIHVNSFGSDVAQEAQTNSFNLRYFSSISFRNDFNQRDDETVSAELEEVGKCRLTPDR